MGVWRIYSLLVALVAVALGSCERAAEPPAAAQAQDSVVATGCPPTIAIDGIFTGWKQGAPCWEWQTEPKVTGVNGIFHIDSSGSGELRFLNDWHLRKNPVCPNLYNRFLFSTADGAHGWEVRVFGDSHLTVLRDGVEFVGKAEAAYSFATSPDVAVPHAIFEFRLPGVELGDLHMLLADPIADSDDPAEKEACLKPKCTYCLKPLPSSLLTDEPTALTAKLTEKGVEKVGALSGTVAVVLQPNRASSGSLVRVLGIGFGKVAGSVTVGNQAVQVVQWSDTEVQFVLGGMKPGGSAAVRLVVQGNPINELTVYDMPVQSPPKDASDSQSGPDAGGETNAPSCPGGSSCPCQGNTDCLSGYCAATSMGKACAASCNSSPCPPGMKCVQVHPGASSDAIPVCVDPFPTLCDPCQSTNECFAPGLPAAFCIDHGGAGSFCGAACTSDQDCPPTYTCAAAKTVAGQSVKQCLRKGGAACECSVAAMGLELLTSCYQVIGGAPTGCSGKRKCLSAGKPGAPTGGGLTACEFSGLTTETCDGIDNDCNGLTDEGTCDDGNGCTTDQCQGGACTFKATVGLACDDKFACTSNDVCTASGDCLGAPVVCGTGQKCCTTGAQAGTCKCD